MSVSVDMPYYERLWDSFRHPRKRVNHMNQEDLTKRLAEAYAALRVYGPRCSAIEYVNGAPFACADPASRYEKGRSWCAVHAHEDAPWLEHGKTLLRAEEARNP